MAENQKLTTEELGALQVLNTNFQNTKIKIAECELQKVKLIAELDAFRKDFASMEKELINKYGDKVQINLQTGEVNPPKEEDVMESLEEVE